MDAEHGSEAVTGRARRMSVGGKLSFRRRVPLVAQDAELPLVDGGDDPPPLAELVPDGYARVDVEIGPGKGVFLAVACAARPDTFVVGIEASPAYAAVAAARLHDAGLRNGLVLVDNGALFLRDRVHDAALSRLHVYFPDPWPKRRHRRRRFFHDGVAEVVHRVLASDGLLLVATDNAAYAGQICRVLGGSPLLRRDVALERDLAVAGPGHAFTPTSFERKYREEGRILRHYAWRKATP